jgi:hypothetical protein
MIARKRKLAWAVGAWGAALVTWTVQRAWMGSKLAAHRKGQTARRGRLVAGNLDAAIRCSTEISAC